VAGAHGRDLITVGGNDTALGEAHFGDALPDPHDERKAGKQTKRFSGETGRAQAGWDDGERPHTRRWGAAGRKSHAS
jgi:hypothetical protein